MLLTRIFTAVIGIPIVFACVYFGEVPFYLMMFVVSFISVLEYLAISKKYEPHAVTSLIMSAAFFMVLCFCRNWFIDKTAISAIVMLFVFFWLEMFGENPNLCVERISSSFLGAFFIPLALAHMVYIRNLCDGMKLVLFVFIVVWVLDTAAYIFGIEFGKHKLAENISPKKTIEGAIAGVVFGVLAAITCKYVFMCDILTLQNSVVLGFIIAVMGQFSDLAESLIKRDDNVKDSGKIIPGHGGVFDRFDSYIFVAPAVYYFMRFLK